MKYFVIEIVTASGSTAKQITEKDNIDSAKMLYHQVLASAYANENVSYAMSMIVDYNGRIDMLEVINKQ